MATSDDTGNELNSPFEYLQALTTEAVSDNSTSSLLDDDDVMSTWLQVLLVTLYAVIFLLGMSGNSLVVYVIVRNKSMQNPTNVFINNLALSDIMMCMLAVPFTPISGLASSWILGEVLCHLVPMSLGVSVYVSSLTSIAIAVDRYFAIVHPFKPRISVPACCVVILVIWVASSAVSLPLALYRQLEPDEATNLTRCGERWPENTGEVFTVTSLVLQYLVPCAIITVCYSLVSLALDRRAKQKKTMCHAALVPVEGGEGGGTRDSRREGGVSSNGRNTNGQATSLTSDREQLEIRRKRRTNRMLIAMVTIFVCCWLPLNVVILTELYYPELGEWKYFLLLFFSAHVTAMSSTVYNPFLYAWMNDSFKKEFKKVVPFLFLCSCASCSTCCHRGQRSTSAASTGAELLPSHACETTMMNANGSLYNHTKLDAKTQC